MRILNEEWNVYRRYSQFTEFHKELRKQYNVVSSISLPPKKTIGNKVKLFILHFISIKYCNKIL